MKSIMEHNFSRIPAPQIQRSLFDRSCGVKTAFDSGLLIPFYVDEILPGDTVRLQCTVLARIATLIFPIMDNVFLDTFFFFVPNRLVWSNWEKFNGAQDSPGDPINFLIPAMVGPVVTEFTLPDYFGIPVGAHDAAERINVLPLRAYKLIWNEWFRDQELQPKVAMSVGDGPDVIADHATILSRGKRHDYFTSCRLAPQRGAAVALSLGTSAPVVGNLTGITWVHDAAQAEPFQMHIGGANQVLGNEGQAGVLMGTVISSNALEDSGRIIGLTTTAANSGMIADLSAATASTVNQLRTSFAIQKVLERDARGGTRYVEMLKSHFGVTSPDFRLQRPEYLGGYSQRMEVRQVAQTAISGATPKGDLSAYGQLGSQSGFNKSFVEHGYVIGIVNVRADIVYQAKLDKMWSRSTRYDFYLPVFAHLGEQAVLAKEIFYPPGGVGVNAVFGYQERWAEYRYKNSMVTGIMRSNATGTLEAWHLSIDYAAIPALNAAFIVDAPPIDRVIAVPSQPHVILDAYFSIKHARPMPVYSVPGQLDRF